MEFQGPNEKSAETKSSAPSTYPAMLLTAGCQEVPVPQMALQPAAHAYARAGTEAATETGMIARMVVPARTVYPMRARRSPVRLAIAADTTIIDIGPATAQPPR